MAGLARIGDYCGGGVITTGAGSVFINSLPAAQIGSFVSGHHDKHYAQTIVTGSPSILIESIPAAQVNSLASCGHVVSVGSENVSGG